VILRLILNCTKSIAKNLMLCVSKYVSRLICILKIEFGIFKMSFIRRVFLLFLLIDLIISSKDAVSSDNNVRDELIQDYFHNSDDLMFVNHFHSILDIL